MGGNEVLPLFCGRLTSVSVALAMPATRRLATARGPAGRRGSGRKAGQEGPAEDGEEEEWEEEEASGEAEARATGRERTAWRAMLSASVPGGWREPGDAEVRAYRPQNKVAACGLKLRDSFRARF